MKISTRGRYGLKALVDLAAQEDSKCITLKSIAERQGISEHYLEQLIAHLKKAGLVQSVRGAQGGYHLKVPASEISVGDVLRVMEGSLYPVECVLDPETGSCGAANCTTCATKTVWERMYRGMNDVMDSITLQNLVDDYRKMLTEEASKP